MTTKQKHYIKVYLLGWFALLSMLLTFCGLMFCDAFVNHDVGCLCTICERFLDVENIQQCHIRCGMITATLHYLSFDLIYYFLKEYKKDV